jgi:hypothetical protein
MDTKIVWIAKCSRCGSVDRSVVFDKVKKTVTLADEAISRQIGNWLERLGNIYVAQDIISIELFVTPHVKVSHYRWIQDVMDTTWAVIASDLR